MVKWDYIYLDVGPIGWNAVPTPRYVNGQEILNWTTGVSVHEVMSQLGELGWELVVANPIRSLDGFGNLDKLYWVYIFKRPRFDEPPSHTCMVGISCIALRI